MSTDATPDSATRAARKLVEQDKVDIVIGPLSGSEGIAVKDYAHTQTAGYLLQWCLGSPGYHLA